LPVRNGGEYLKECVRSILAQTYTKFNLIVLDNNSSDGTREWIYSLQNEKIIIIPSEKDLTIEENWARINNIPKNEFMTMIGHDDILLPTYLENISILIEKYPEASLFQTHFSFIDNQSNKIKDCKKMDMVENVEHFLNAFLQNKIDINGTGYMMSSKDYEAVGGIPTNYPNLLYADMELWLHLTSLSFKVTALETCFYYRIHESTTKNTNTEKLYNAFKKFIDFLHNFKESNQLHNGHFLLNIKRFINNSCLSFVHRLLKASENSRGNLQVEKILNERKQLLKLFSLSTNCNNLKQNLNFKLSSIIDLTKTTRKAFYLFNKKLRKK
jgi:glycosyltransferase involved in cell wall biosynthesis